MSEERVAKYAEAVKIASESRAALMSARVRGNTALANWHDARLREAKETIRVFKRDTEREKRAAREAKLPFVAGVWEQNDDPERELCIWSRHATEKAAKAAARRYARRVRSEGPVTGGAHSWSGGWRGPTGGTTWINADGEET